MNVLDFSFKGCGVEPDKEFQLAFSGMELGFNWDTTAKTPGLLYWNGIPLRPSLHSAVNLTSILNISKLVEYGEQREPYYKTNYSNCIIKKKKISI